MYGHPKTTISLLRLHNVLTIHANIFWIAIEIVRTIYLFVYSSKYMIYINFKM